MREKSESSIGNEAGAEADREDGVKTCGTGDITARAGADRRHRGIDTRTIVLGSAGVLAAVALIAMLQSPGEAGIAQADDAGHATQVESATAGVRPADASASAPLSARTEFASVPVSAPKAVAPVRAPERSSASESELAPVVAPESAAKQLAEPPPLASRSIAAPLIDSSTLTPVSTKGEQEGTPATIAGCLGVEADSFRLKDTSGDGAPKSRSWKSGFIKKRSSSVELVDGATTRRLAAYVGQRIETTGLLVDRQMRVKTLRVLGSCD